MLFLSVHFVMCKRNKLHVLNYEIIFSCICDVLFTLNLKTEKIQQILALIWHQKSIFCHIIVLNI